MTSLHCTALPSMGDAVSDGVGDGVGDAVGDAVGYAVGDAVGDAVGGAVGDAKLGLGLGLGYSQKVGWQGDSSKFAAVCLKYCKCTYMSPFKNPTPPNCPDEPPNSVGA